MNKPVNLVIDCRNIYKSYYLGKLEIMALSKLNLTVQAGEQIAILGPSGSGKSTLMNILGCLDVPNSGQYILDGSDVSQLTRNQLAIIRNHKIGFVFQSFNLLAHATAVENVALPLLYRGGISFRAAKQQAAKVLNQVALHNRLQHMPNELSGGERQRVAIARALVTQPNLLLADEPTGNLDTQTGNEVMQLFETLASEGKTIIIVTHDLDLAKRVKRIIKLKDGKIEEAT